MDIKVRLTSYGVPFGREMHYEVAMIYFKQTQHVLRGISFKVVEYEQK